MLKQHIMRLLGGLFVLGIVAAVSIVVTTVVLLVQWLSSPEKTHEATPTAGVPERLRLVSDADRTGPWGCADRVDRLTGLLAESANLAGEGSVRVGRLIEENARLRRENAEVRQLQLGR